MSTFGDSMIDEVTQLRKRHTEEMALKNKHVDELEIRCRELEAALAEAEARVAELAAQKPATLKQRVEALEAALRDIADYEEPSLEVENAFAASLCGKARAALEHK